MNLGIVLQFNVVCRSDQWYIRNWKEHKPKILIQNQGILPTEDDIRRVIMNEYCTGY